MSAMQKIGIVGAGQMGAGIAQVCALAGFEVLLNDVSAERIQSGLATINGNLARQVAGGKLTEEERTAALARIVAAESYDALADADLIIEAAVENEKVKREILAGLSKAVKPETMLATNTS